MALNYDITSRDWDNTDVNVNITDPDGFNGIIDLDNDNASFSEGTLTDVVATADGLELKNDYALNFESTSGNYVDLPPSAIPSGNELTAEFLIYGGDALPKQTCLIEARSGTETTLRTINIHLPWSTGDVYFDCGNDGTGYDRIQKTATASEYKGSWHHWAFTKNANTGEMKIYLDGNLWYSETGKTLSIPVTASTVALGADFEGLTNFWDGKIKEVRLWEVERTQNQIQTNMNNELQGDETGLVAYYKIKEGEGNTLTDYAGSNDGTINGATWTVDETRYLTTGTRQSPQLDLSAVNDVASSSISWQETSSAVFSEDWDTQPYPTRTTIVNSVDGVLDVTSTDNDPNITMYNLGSFDPNIYKYIEIKYKVISGTAGNAQIFFTNSQYTIANGAQVINKSINSDGKWHTMFIDMSAHANWTDSNITGWRYDWCTADDVRMELDYIKLTAMGTTNNIIKTSVDSGSTWQVATNGGAIPNLPADPTTLDVRQTLNTNDTTVTPVLENLTVEIKTPIKYKWDLNTATPSSWNDVSNPITQSSDGAWYLHTRYFENNSPVTEYKGTFNIDKTPPTGSWTYDTSCDWTNTYPTVWWSGDAGISGGFEERYKITSSTTKPTSWSATGSSEGGIALQDDGYPMMEALGDGEWYCHIEYEDNAGNVTYDYTGPFKIDTEPPALTWLNHVTGWQKTIPDLKCSNDGGLSGMQTAKYAITSTSTKPTSWSTDTTPAQTVFMTSLTNAGDGELYVHQEAFDNAGNSTYEYKFLQIDTTPPAAPNATLVNNTSHSLSLGWTNSDATSGVDYVELYAEESDGSLNYVADIDIDGDSNTEPSIQLTNTDISYTVDGLSEYTNYRYKVRVFDKAGNFSEDTYAEMITDDITEPVVGYNLNSRDWLNTNVDETVNVDDQAGSGVAEAWYKWTNSPIQPTDGWIVMGTTTNFATSQSQEGEWYLHIKATDNYNNTAYDYSGPYKVDKTAPIISSTNVTLDSPTGIYDTYTATISWTVEDQSELSGVDRTEIGFYADGVWHYDETTLPDGITTNVDMDNVTGAGAKTAIFSNVPREIEVAASFNGYDVATNNTGEKQSDLIFTPRIYASHTLTGLSDYEMGINSDYKSQTEYETGINKNYQSPSSQIIDVLSKAYDSPVLYEIGKRTEYKSQTLYEAGINKTEGPVPSLQDILVLYDEPILVSGKFSQGVRLGVSDLEIDIRDFNEWTMHVFRRGIDDSEFRTIFINSDGEVYVDNEINNEYDISWFESTNEKITIKSGAIDIDELLVIPQIIDQKQIDRYGGSPFYDPNENIKVDMPDSVDMEVMQ